MQLLCQIQKRVNLWISELCEYHFETVCPNRDEAIPATAKGGMKFDAGLEWGLMGEPEWGLAAL